MLKYLLIALLAFSGCTKKETPRKASRFSLRTAVGTSPLSVSPASEVWVTGLGNIAFQATSEIPGATIKWERLQDGASAVVSQDANFAYTAPALEYPCQVKNEKFLVTTRQGSNVLTRPVTVHVQNTHCVLNEDSGLTSNDTTKLLFASDKALYIGTRNGLTRYKEGRINKEFKTGNNETIEVVTALGEGDSAILVGKAKNFLAYPMRGFGLNRVSFREDGNETRAFWHPSVKFASSFISGIFFNRNRDLPFPEVLTAHNYTTGGGVLSSSNTMFEDLSGPILAGESIYAALEVGHQTYFGGDGGIFIVEGAALVHRFDGSDWGGKGGLFGVGSNRSVRALAKDSLGNIWIGLQASTFEKGGLIKYQPGANFRDGTFSNPLSIAAGNNIRALLVDDADALWIATDNGLVRKDVEGNFKTFRTEVGLPSNDIRDLAYDADSRGLWVATSAGVARLALSLLK